MNKKAMHKFDGLKSKSADAFSDIPEAYFQTLAEKTEVNILKAQAAKKKRFAYLAAAASFLALVSLSVFLFQTNNRDSNSQLANSNSTTIILKDSSTKSYDTNEVSTIDTIRNIYYEEVNFDLLFEEVPLETIIQYLKEMNELEF
jgi:hypothetical protein